MRLSEAILLGATAAKPGDMGGGNLSVGLQHIGETRCALELGLIAAGRPELHWEAASLVWPWLRSTIEGCNVIVKWDSEYLKGTLSLDAYIDWVRSVEPEETPSPTDAIAKEEVRAEVV